MYPNGYTQRFPSESPPRQEKMDATLSQETKGHAGARIYCLSNQDQQLSQIIPAHHCRQECHQATGR